MADPLSTVINLEALANNRSLERTTQFPGQRPKDTPSTVAALPRYATERAQVRNFRLEAAAGAGLDGARLIVETNQPVRYLRFQLQTGPEPQTQISSNWTLYNSAESVPIDLGGCAGIRGDLNTRQLAVQVQGYPLPPNTIDGTPRSNLSGVVTRVVPLPAALRPKINTQSPHPALLVRDWEQTRHWGSRCRGNRCLVQSGNPRNSGAGTLGLELAHIPNAAGTGMSIQLAESAGCAATIHTHRGRLIGDRPDAVRANIDFLWQLDHGGCTTLNRPIRLPVELRTCTTQTTLEPLRSYEPLSFTVEETTSVRDWIVIDYLESSPHCRVAETGGDLTLNSKPFGGGCRFKLTPTTAVPPWTRVELEFSHQPATGCVVGEPPNLSKMLMSLPHPLVIMNQGVWSLESSYHPYWDNFDHPPLWQ
ncbi:MAG: hypothetical protein AAF918_00440 [Pseudomonadota bacterium]